MNTITPKDKTYDILKLDEGVPVKMWTRGVSIEKEAEQQLINITKMPFIYKWVAAMPDCHWGIGATVGSVIPTKKAIIPAAVGVDIGCGMVAARTSLSATDLPDNLAPIRAAIEKAVPHGRTNDGGPGDRGAWSNPPKSVETAWTERFMLHSGSRGVGNQIGRYFIELAKKDMETWLINLPDANLAYLPEGTEHFDEYWKALMWAQTYARTNRDIMMHSVVEAVRNCNLPEFEITSEVVNCHHNYAALENHYGTNVYVTRKGAVRARKGDLGIIPGSMGTRSYIVEGKGNPESFNSCSHGAGRAMSRGDAKRKFTLEDHIKATEGIECRKDIDVIDETPLAYKPIDAVMEAQNDLVDIRHTLRQVVCVKG